MHVLNEEHSGGDDGAAGTPKQERLVPRTEDLPIYSVAELNDKVSRWLLTSFVCVAYRYSPG